MRDERVWSDDGKSKVMGSQCEFWKRIEPLMPARQRLTDLTYMRAAAAENPKTHSLCLGHHLSAEDMLSMESVAS